MVLFMVVSLSTWLILGSSFGDVIVKSGIIWKAQELSRSTVVLPEELTSLQRWEEMVD